jgi:hypothetical protein
MANAARPDHRYRREQAATVGVPQSSQSVEEDHEREPEAGEESKCNALIDGGSQTLV